MKVTKKIPEGLLDSTVHGRVVKVAYSSYMRRCELTVAIPLEDGSELKMTQFGSLAKSLEYPTTMNFIVWSDMFGGTCDKDTLENIEELADLEHRTYCVDVSLHKGPKGFEYFVIEGYEVEFRPTPEQTERDARAARKLRKQNRELEERLVESTREYNVSVQRIAELERELTRYETQLHPNGKMDKMPTRAITQEAVDTETEEDFLETVADYV